MMIFYRPLQHTLRKISCRNPYVANTARTLSFLILITFATACSSKNPSDMFDEAIVAFDAGKYTPALDLAEKAYRLHKDPKNHKGLTSEALAADTIKFSCFYSICLAKNAKANEALLVLEELAKAYPEDVTVQKLYGESLYTAKKYKQAFTVLKDAYELDHNDKDILKLICTCAIKDFDPKDKSYIEALATYLITPKVPIAKSELAVLYNNIGVWFSLNRYFSTAEKYYFSKPVAISSQLPQVKLNRAIANDNRAKKHPKYNNKAKFLYNLYLKTDPNNDLGVGEDVRARMKTLEGR